MVEHSKRKKFHDKDKYYRLAKEQGLRSRAAFKLTQINRKFPFLEKCQNGVLDLCAAPGGWTQIAARTCPKHIPIVAVDVLPIRSLGPSVTTIVGDITTSKCQADIRNALAGTKVDAVLHDGAPNIGADYSKDAYVQNELAIHALKCATQHLLAGGTYCTKVYRSRDYASLQWVLQQLFGSVSAIKPSASRSQSAEIFLIAQYYKAPSKLDPRMLDPKHIFADVAGDSTGGGANSMSGGMTVFDKNWSKARRKRGGYDHEHLDATMRHVETVKDFVLIPSLKSAVQLLSTSTGLSFTCSQCRKDKKEDSDEEDAGECPCEFLLHHPYTTPEIKECVSDLQVLNQTDFKGLLTWRTKVQEALQARQQIAEEEESDEEDEVPAGGDASGSEEEEEIQKEIEEMRKRRQREKKRQKKKERELAAKRRRRAAMDVMTVDVAEHDKVFSLATLASKGDLEAAGQANLDKMTDEQIFGADSEDDDEEIGEGSDDEEDEESRMARREEDLNNAYQLYLENTKNGLAKSGTKMAKRSKKLQRQKVMEEAAEDQEMAMINGFSDYNARTYAEMLQGPRDSDDDDESSDDEDDDGFNAAPMTPEEHARLINQRKVAKKQAESNPLIHKFDDEEPASMKTARWFSNPLFASIGRAAEEGNKRRNEEHEESSEEESNGKSESEDSEEDSVSSEKISNKKKKGITAEEVMAMMPKTDKQIRHEKRIKALARDERRKARKAKKLGEAEEEFELAPADSDDEDDASEDADLSHLSESQKKKLLEARELIKAGMGKHIEDDGMKGIEIVPAEEAPPLPKMDHRDYRDEGYDSDDYAETLALGTMMLRRSKEKALVDASYNRYAWNDPGDLPEWFVDDESKHYRPQLPIPPALIAKMKEKQLALSAKPIKKVAEARARKSKRARDKLAAAKKKAEAVARSGSDMTEAMKLKAISKALRGQEARKPSKTYVVAKKGRSGPQGGGKGVALVDKRMRADKRAMERKEKKRKKGKQNKLVGSKKRRNHK